MNNAIRSIKGTHDILPEDSKKWQQLESTIRKITHQFGYEEIRTPIFEKTGLFSRSVGEDTDIVSINDTHDEMLCIPKNILLTVAIFTSKDLVKIISLLCVSISNIFNND